MDHIFKDNSSLKVYFKTSDGTPFYTETDAKNYAKSLEDKTVKKVERGFSENQSGTDQSGNTGIPSAKMEWRDAIKAIQESETLEQLEQFKGYAQASVIKALEEKTAQLTAQLEVIGSEEVTGNEDDNQNEA